MEYLRVTESEFIDIAETCQQRGLDLRYSVEDSVDLDGGIEYHIHEPIDEVESFLWAVDVLDGAAIPAGVHR